MPVTWPQLTPPFVTTSAVPFFVTSVTTPPEPVTLTVSALPLIRLFTLWYSS